MPVPDAEAPVPDAPVPDAHVPAAPVPDAPVPAAPAVEDARHRNVDPHAQSDHSRVGNLIGILDKVLRIRQEKGPSTRPRYCGSTKDPTSPQVDGRNLVTNFTINVDVDVNVIAVRGVVVMAFPTCF